MNILFVCTGNTCRSPMAEGFMIKLCNDDNRRDVNVLSGGISAFEGQSVSENSVLALKKYGIDISKHKAANINPDVIKDADYIFTMTSAHSSYLKNVYNIYVDKIFSVGEFTNGDDIVDPYGGDLDEYTKCAEQIYAGVKKIYDRIFGIKND